MNYYFLIQLIAAALFFIGAMTVLLKHNTIIILLGLELMLNGVNLAMVGFSQQYHLLTGQVYVFFIMTIAAAESAIGLSIVLNLYRNFGSISSQSASQIKG
jgi:NADH-quinone oxidoreductase subunit K